MEEVFHQVESIFFYVIQYAIMLIELIGVVVLCISIVRALVGMAKHDKNLRLKLAEGIALALEFKMGGELLRTVIVREWKELLILGAVILLRAAMTVLIHWEIKLHKKEDRLEREAHNAEIKAREVPKELPPEHAVDDSPK